MYAQMKEIDPTFEPALKLRRRDYFGPPPGIDSNLVRSLGSYVRLLSGQIQFTAITNRKENY